LKIALKEVVMSALRTTSYPVAVEARLDEELSRWRWLVKWFLAIPHLVVLALLWLAFAVLTVIAGASIALTGTYPRRIFDFNVGVMRWTWRVHVYAFALGTDRYPPFTLDDDPTYPARLDVEYPAQLSRGLVWVKWWLLAIPHYLIVALIAGGPFPRVPLGALSALGLVAGVALAVTRRYPPSIFPIVVGLYRWCWRVAAYAALMRDEYPPFRLDTGPVETQPDPGPAAPTAAYGT
jgi:hypothetical protein